MFVKPLAIALAIALAVSVSGANTSSGANVCQKTGTQIGCEAK